MPDTKTIIFACLGLFFLMLFLGAIGWIIAHFVLALVIAAAIAGAIYAYRYAVQQGNRV